MKRVLRTTAWLLAMLMLLGTTAFAWEAPTGNFKYFRDIPEEYWAAQDIEWCTDYQVMKDMGNRREFQPDVCADLCKFGYANGTRYFLYHSNGISRCG